MAAELRIRQLVLDDVFRRLIALVAARDSETEHAKEVALEVLDRVRAEIESDGENLASLARQQLSPAGADVRDPDGQAESQDPNVDEADRPDWG